MAIVAYTNPDFSQGSAVPFSLARFPDISFNQTWSGEFLANSFTDDDGNTVNYHFYSPWSGDFAIGTVYNRPIWDGSEILYFPNGTHMSATYSGSGYIWTLSNYFGISRDNGTAIFSGINRAVDATPGGEGFPAGTNQKTHGLVIGKTTLTLYGGEKYSCIYLAFGYERLATDGQTRFFMVGEGLLITENYFSGSFTDPSGGIPISPEGGDGTYTLHAETLSFGTAEGRSDDMGGGGLAAGSVHGTHLYDMDLSAFSDFMGTAYAGTGSLSFSDLWQAYKNSMHDPLSGILGALILPIAPPSTAVTYIRLSGQSIAVSGSCGYVTKRFGETLDASVSLEDTFYGTFLDFEPFTKITLYLPFVGSVGLNTNECMGGGISVRYWIDYCTGNCVAYVTLTDRFGKPSYYQYSGNCAAYIPVSGNDAGISSIISGASSVITGTVQAMSGNPAGIGSMIGGGLQIAEPKTTQKHVGGFSGGSGCVGCLYPYIVINHPSAATDDGYTGIMGAPSGLNGTVGQYHGFTAFMHADTHGVPATAEELQEIEGALSEGVYL